MHKDPELGLDLLEGKYFDLSNASVSYLDIDPRGKVKKFHINDYQHIILAGLKNKQV